MKKRKVISSVCVCPKLTSNRDINQGDNRASQHEQFKKIDKQGKAVKTRRVEDEGCQGRGLRQGLRSLRVCSPLCCSHPLRFRIGYVGCGNDIDWSTAEECGNASLKQRRWGLKRSKREGDIERSGRRTPLAYSMFHCPTRGFGSL